MANSQQRPSFPSLYSPHFNFSVSPSAKYLHSAHDIYIFTLYWTFILYLPLFLFTGLCAAFFLIVQPLRGSNTSSAFGPVSFSVSKSEANRTSSNSQGTLSARTRNQSVAYGIAVLVLYGLTGVLLSVLSSTVIGFLIAAVYAAGKFRVSTWIPFLWVLTQSFVTLTSMCVLIIDIL